METTLASSRLARAFVATGAMATMALAFALPMAGELRALAAAWAAIAALHALHRLRGTRTFVLDHTGSMSVDGVEGRLRDGSFVAPWLVVVRWRPDRAWRVRTLVVAPDMLAAEDFRRLRVLLKWG